MRAFYSACICSALALAACTSAVPHPGVEDATWASARWPGASFEQLAHGRDLYVAKCGSCHSLYAPSSIASARWPSTVDDMVTNAAISTSERDLIVHYLLTASRARGDEGSGNTEARRSGHEPDARSSN